MKRIYYLLLPFLLVSCLANNLVSLVDDLDLRQVRLLSYKSIDVDKLLLEFNSEIDVLSLDVIGHSIKYYETKDNLLYIYLNERIFLSTATYINGCVEDTLKNSLAFSIPVKGYNDNIASLVISEIRLKSTEKRPDSIELYVTKDGNLSGVTLYLGIKDDYKEKYTFSNFEVTRGEIIVIKVGKGENEYYKTYDMPNLPGLSSTMGVITIEDQDNKLQDAVFYSNRNSETEDGYDGLYSKRFKNQVDYIYKKGGWIDNKISSAIDPSSSTSTRTLVRYNSFKDTNSKDDWSITKTKGCSIGYINLD